MKVRVGICVMLVLAVLVGALPVLADSEAVLGPVWGGMEAGFAYYTFDYAGDGSAVTVELNYAPGGPIADGGIKVKVYFPDETVAAEAGGVHGAVSAEVASAVAGTYTIEIANYNGSLPISYGLVVKGAAATALVIKGEAAPVAEEAAAVEEVAEEAAPVAEEVAVVEEVAEEAAPVAEEAAVVEEVAEEAAPVAEEAAPVAGVLGPVWSAMESGFVYYTFDYAGDGSDMTVELNYAPGGPIADGGVKVKVYFPDETVAGEAGGAHGAVSVKAASAVAGTYTIEIANYNGSLPIGFGLVVKGDGVSNLMPKAAAVEVAEVAEVVEVAEVAEAAE